MSKSVSFKTYGCSNNFAESELMAGLLKEKGFSTEEDGDVVIFNMCSVKGPSVNHCLNQIKELKKAHPEKKVVVAGCVPRNLVATIRKIDPSISILSTHHVDQIGDVVEKTLKDQPQKRMGYEPKVKVNLPKVRKNPVISIIPILNGCNDACTYCSTVLIKGKTFSYPAKDIIAEVEHSVADGCKEIWLTSQDNGAYHTDKPGPNLPQLIKQMTDVRGAFYIRVGMANPTYLLDYLDELVEAMQHDKVFKFIHIPVQAGSDKVLKDMQRRYTVAEYKHIVNTLKKHIPDVTIATDIICGFPEETDEEFQETMELIKETKPEVINISRFQPRFGTKAAKMKQVPGGIIKERSRELTLYYEEYRAQLHKDQIGKEFYVIVDEHKKEGTCMARTENYTAVAIKTRLPLGTICKVKIVDATTHHLVAEEISFLSQAD